MAFPTAAAAEERAKVAADLKRRAALFRAAMPGRVLALDPASGVVDGADSAKSGLESDLLALFFPFRELGCCRAIQHPEFGANAVVGFLHVSGELADIQRALPALRSET